MTAQARLSRGARSMRARVRARLRPGRADSVLDMLGGRRDLMPDPLGVAVLVAGRTTDSPQVAAWTTALTGATVHVLTRTGVGPEAGRLHDELKRLGPVDLVADLRRDGFAAQRARWRRLFFHLRSGGAYVVSTGGRVPVETLAAQVQQLRAEDGETRELRQAIAGIETAGAHVVVRKRLTHRLKLREADVAAVLPTREPGLTVTELSSRPGGSFVSRAVVIHHESDRAFTWPPAEIDYPQLFLRRYEGDIAFHGQTLMHTGHSILPDSFRWLFAGYLKNPLASNASADFARIAPRTLPERDLPGSYYQLDPQYPGFGHVMTEVVGRLWGWDEAKAADPDLKALFHIKHIEKYRSNARYLILRGWGIADDDIVAIDRPVRVRSIASGTVMWHNAEPFYVHPQLAQVWSRLGDGLIAPDVPVHEKIFVSRSERYTRRTCHNQAEVEKVFLDAGFTVIYPEDLALGEQVAIFRSARVVAGFGGSALFNVAFAERLECTIVLTHDAYYHRNEHLYTALLGGQVHYFWSASDVSPEEATGAYEAVESSWSFDFARHGAALRALLADR